MSLKLLVGLGNPGPTYAFTRHNVGFMCLDELAERAGAKFALNARMRAHLTRLSIPAAPGRDSVKLLLAKPTTFMNESGISVAALASFHKIEPADVVVIHDELDLDPGRLRLKFGGGDNGHNGLKSVRRHLHTGDFYRVRIGVGRPPGRQDPAAWVLARLNSQAVAELRTDASRAGDAVLELVTSGLESAQNQFNT